MSASDLEAGVRWAGEVGRSLEQTDFGIICLTAENLTAPWILFEAGALSKRFENARVLPYLFKLSQSDVSGPLTQFQNVNADKEGTRRLVGAIYSVLLSPQLSPDRLDRTFDRWWPELEEKLNSVPDIESQLPKEEHRNGAAVLDEILGTVRSLQRYVIRTVASPESPTQHTHVRGARGVGVRKVLLSSAEREERELFLESAERLLSSNPGIFAQAFRQEHPEVAVPTMDELRSFARRCVNRGYPVEVLAAIRDGIAGSEDWPT